MSCRHSFFLVSGFESIMLKLVCTLAFCLRDLLCIICMHCTFLEHIISLSFASPQDCLPQYLVGHVQKLSGIQQHIADRGLNLTPLGASYQGLGVNECIYNARLAVEGYLAKLRT